MNHQNISTKEDDLEEDDILRELNNPANISLVKGSLTLFQGNSRDTVSGYSNL
jgi:hypothetical protein